MAMIAKGGKPKKKGAPSKDVAKEFVEADEGKMLALDAKKAKPPFFGKKGLGQADKHRKKR